MSSAIYYPPRYFYIYGLAAMVCVVVGAVTSSGSWFALYWCFVAAERYHGATIESAVATCFRLGIMFGWAGIVFAMSGEMKELAKESAWTTWKRRLLVIAVICVLLVLSWVRGQYGGDTGRQPLKSFPTFTILSMLLTLFVVFKVGWLAKQSVEPNGEIEKSSSLLTAFLMIPAVLFFLIIPIAFSLTLAMAPELLEQWWESQISHHVE